MATKHIRVLVPDNEVPGKPVVAYSTPAYSTSQPTSQSEGKDLWDGYIWVNPDSSYMDSDGAQKMYIGGNWINVGLSIGDTEHTVFSGSRGVALEGRVGVLESEVGSFTGTINIISTTVSNKYTAPKIYTNVQVLISSWQADTTYTDFAYRATVLLTGALSTTTPDVIFSLTDARRGIFALVAESIDGGIYIYASEVPVDIITIAKIILWPDN